MQWYWQGKSEALGAKPVPLSLCRPQMSHGLVRNWTRASAVRVRLLTAWSNARPTVESIRRPPLEHSWYDVLGSLISWWGASVKWIGRFVSVSVNRCVKKLENVDYFKYLGGLKSGAGKGWIRRVRLIVWKIKYYIQWRRKGICYMQENDGSLTGLVATCVGTAF